MNRAGGFAANGLNDAKMRVPKRVHGDPTKKSRYFLPFESKTNAPRPCVKRIAERFVGRQKELLGIPQSRGRTRGV